MSIKEKIHAQIVGALNGVGFPIKSPEAFLASFPDGAETTCKADGVELKAVDAGKVLKPDDFPFKNAKEVADVIVERAELNNMSNSNKLSKALVLSGGGLKGIAWELGLLWGLKESGVDVTDVDLIIGTSAGSNVGAQITSGISLEELYKNQLKPSEETKEISEFDFNKFVLIITEAMKNSSDPQTIRANIGKAAFNVKTMSEEERLEIVASRLPKKDWNQKIQFVLNAIDAETGEWVTFDKDSGVPILLAVAASSSLPGLSPPTAINGRHYIDGGLSSLSNADLAQEKDRVLIIVAEPALMEEKSMLSPMYRITFENELKVLKKSG